MPTTVNGIGTHYYGKSNRSVRSGVCKSCGGQTQLESYDTTLWFVVIFIPIIPLGRKRIMDQCSRCNRHYVADHAKYEMARQLNVSGALEQYRSQSTPEAALAAHGSLLSFHMHGEAEKFRQSILLEHPQSAELRVGLAGHMEQTGRYDEALGLLDEAYKLRPDLPEARAGAARIRIGEGKLSEARELLDFLLQPGAGQLYSLQPLESLAIAYQKAGQHDETLRLCKHIIDELPKVGQAPGFRKFIAVSERALGRGESILPRRSFSLRNLLRGSEGQGRWMRRLTWAAVIAGIVLVVMAGLNEYWRRHRTLIAMNDCGQPVQVALDGGPAVPVDRTSRLEVAEGPHHVKITGPINEEFDINMSTGYFERFGKSPAWVVMAGQGTVLQEDTIHYSVIPRPGNTRLIAAKQIYYAPHIDYLFTAPPRELKVDSKTPEVTKTFLHSVGEPAHVLVNFIAREDLPGALKFAETRLIGSHDDAQLLENYVQIAEAAHESPRAQAYLKAGLDRQPISVAWHRAYQDAGKSPQRKAAMEKEYDALVQKSPRDAGLLYLAGRVATNREKARRLFRKACDADPKLHWPCFALAYDAMCAGDWQNCRRLAEKAQSLGDYAGAADLIHVARLGLGDLDSLELECRVASAGKENDTDLAKVMDLCEIHAIRGRTNDAQAAVHKWQQQLPPDARAAMAGELATMLVAYMCGDFDAAAGAGSNGDDKQLAEMRLQSLLAGGRVAQVAGDASLQELLAEPSNALQMSVAWAIAGDSAQAAVWREKAAAAWEHRDTDMKRAADMLRAANAPTESQLNDLVLIPPLKSLLVAALVQRFPQQKAELAPIARKLNVTRRPPYQLVRQVVEQAASTP